MKILHTADWHMSSTLGRVDLSADILGALRQIEVYLEHYQVDVMVVAGDLFKERLRDDKMHEAVSAIREIFGPFVQRGGTFLAVAGNHDPELKFEMLRETLALGMGNGRFVITANPSLTRVVDPNGQTVQFALLPYPTTRGYLRGDDVYATLEEKNRLLQARFGEALAALKSQLDPNWPAVLVSHIHVRGASSHSLYNISESDDVVFDAAAIAPDWAYVAYGHIHKPGEAVAGAPHVRYSGSPIMLDAAERHDHKGCVLFEIRDDKCVGEIQILPLDGPKIHQITFDLSAEVPAQAIARWKEEIEDRDLVRYTLVYDPQDEPPLAQIKAQIETSLGRVYARDEELANAQIGDAPVIGEAHQKRADVPEIVRDYLTRNLSGHTESAPILALAEELLASP